MRFEVGVVSDTIESLRAELAAEKKQHDNQRDATAEWAEACERVKTELAAEREKRQRAERRTSEIGLYPRDLGAGIVLVQTFGPEDESAPLARDTSVFMAMTVLGLDGDETWAAKLDRLLAIEREARALVAALSVDSRSLAVTAELRRLLEAN